MFFISAPAWAAECGGVNTGIVDCEAAEDDSIGYLLRDIVNILSIGVGILGVIGITIVGVQYLTAGGDEQKVIKSKRRMLEIVIGLVIYAVFFAIVQWLGVNPNGDTSIKGSGTHKKSVSEVVSKETASGKGTDAKAKASKTGKKVASAAATIAKQLEANKAYYCKTGTYSGKDTKCIGPAGYVSAAGRKAGIIKEGGEISICKGEIKGEDNLVASKVKITYHPSKKNRTKGTKLSTLVKKGKLVKGDIVGAADSCHVMIYKKKKNKKYYFYSVNSKYGKTEVDKKHPFAKKQITTKTYKGSHKISVIIHAK